MIDPSLFTEHDDETLAGMHGLDVAEVATQRAALDGKAVAAPQQAAPAVAEAPPAEPAAEPAEKPKRGQKPKPAPEAPAPAADASRQVFRVEIPYDDTTGVDVFRFRLMAAVDAEIAKLPAHLQDRPSPQPAERAARQPGAAVKFVGSKPLKVRLPGSRSAAELGYGDIYVGADADYLAEHHAEHVEAHPRPKR